MELKLSDLSVCTVRVELRRDRAGARFPEFYIRVIDVEEVARGSLNEMILTARKVFKGAVLANAAMVMLVHNHPSGFEYPSFEDMDMTGFMMTSGEVLGIKVMDHVIIGRGCYSLRERLKLGAESLERGA